MMTLDRSVTVSFTALTGPRYYFSSCGPGSAAGCVAGNNSNAGTSAAMPKQNLSGFDLNSLPAGTQLLFARGAVFPSFTHRVRNLNVTLQQPLVFDAYTPAWGGSARPILLGTAGQTALGFGQYQDTIRDGAYVVRNLAFDGQGTGLWAIYVADYTRNVTLENLELARFAIGVHSVSTYDDGNQALVVRGCHIHDNSEHGMLGSATDLLVEDNRIERNNPSGGGFEHGIYLGGHGSGVVRYNHFAFNSVDSSGSCTGGNFTVHGQWDGLLVEGNRIEQTSSTGGCYGISINSAYSTPEYFRNLVVRGNTIENVGNCAVCLTSAPGAVVENNFIVNTQATYHTGIIIPDRAAGPGDDGDSGAIVRNNTIIQLRAAMGSGGIELRANSGTGAQVVSNLVFFGAQSNAAHQCFAHRPRADYVAFDANLCHHAAGTGQWSTQFSSLSAAQAGGFDGAGSSANPGFAMAPTLTSFSDLLQANSPARAQGHPTRSSVIDRMLAPRAVPDIGSRQH